MQHKISDTLILGNFFNKLLILKSLRKNEDVLPENYK